MPTFEETDALIRMAAAPVRLQNSAVSATGAPSNPLSLVCSAYAIIKPILQGIAATPIFPVNWKDAIDEFLTVMEGICAPGALAQAVTPDDLNFTAIDTRVKQSIAAHWATCQTVSVLATSPVSPGLGSEVAVEICGVYKVIKPILDIAKMFVPGPWGVGIGTAEDVLDAVCKSI